MSQPQACAQNPEQIANNRAVPEGSLSAMNLSLALASATKIAFSLGCATATFKAVAGLPWPSLRGDRSLDRLTGEQDLPGPRSLAALNRCSSNA